MRNPTSPASSTTNGLTLYRPRRAPAELPMNVVYVVYVVRTGFKPLSQEKQGLKQLGNPPIPLLRSRSQRSQRTQCSSVNTPCGAVARTPLAGSVGPMTLAGLA